MSQTERIVFVVDDERVIAKTLAILLNNSGFAATPFHSAEETMIAARNVKPDMLISDVMIPDMTGVELAVYFRRIQPTCKILLFSGQASTVDLLVEARKQWHGFKLLSKPIHPADLLARLRR